MDQDLTLSEMRQSQKEIHFGVLLPMGPSKLSAPIALPTPGPAEQWILGLGTGLNGLERVLETESGRHKYTGTQ